MYVNVTRQLLGTFPNFHQLADLPTGNNQECYALGQMYLVYTTSRVWQHTNLKTVYSRPGCAIINPVASCWITRLFHGCLVTGWRQSSPRLEFSSALNYLCPQSTKQRIWILPKTMNNSIYENFYLACQQTVFKVSIFRDIFYLFCQQTVLPTGSLNPVT